MTRNQRRRRLWVRILALAVGGVTAMCSSLGQRPDDASAKLKFVLILSRHGVRTPTGSADQLNPYSAQPWPNWEVAPGNLTPHGAKLMTIFGAYYRSYFAQHGLLAAEGCTDAAKVSIYADSDKRTVETGAALATGLFPSCAIDQRPEQHSLPENQVDPLFHSLTAGTIAADHERAVASIAGRIGNDPEGIAKAYSLPLELLQRILLGCPVATPCPSAEHKATRLLLDVPASLVSGKGDHLAELRGPLSTASTITEDLLLEYTDGMPMDQVGWGHVDLETLKQLLDLHTGSADLGRRTPYIATVQASNIAAHIQQTLQQAVLGTPVPGALGKVGDRAVVLVGHNTNLANLAGMLNLNWLIDGRRDDTPPGGAMVFELWENAKTSSYEVRTYYTAQTLQQMRSMTPLNLEHPPDRADIFIPACSEGRSGYPCEWSAFKQALNKTIDPDFVR